MKECYDCESHDIEQGTVFNELLGYSMRKKLRCKKCGSYRIIETEDFEE